MRTYEKRSTTKMDTFNSTDMSFNYYWMNSSNSPSGSYHCSEERRHNGEVAIYLSSVFTAMILILNGIVIWLIGRRTKITRLYCYLLNLAIADLATGLFDVLPRTLERSIDSMYLPYPNAAVHLCRSQRLLGHTALVTSNFILAAMSIDRAQVVTNPMRRFNKGQVLLKFGIPVLCWILGFLCSIPITVIHKIRHGNCDIYFEVDPLFWWQANFTFGLVVSFLIPLIIIIISYTVLLVSIHRRGIAATASTESSESRTFNRCLPRSKLISIKLTFGIIMSFILSWTPYMLFHALQVYARMTFCYIVIITCLRYLNSVANPVMYFIFHHKKQADSARRTQSSETLQTFLSSMRGKLKCNGRDSMRSSDSYKRDSDIPRLHQANGGYKSNDKLNCTTEQLL